MQGCLNLLLIKLSLESSIFEMVMEGKLVPFISEALLLFSGLPTGVQIPWLYPTFKYIICAKCVCFILHTYYFISCFVSDSVIKATF